MHNEIKHLGTVTKAGLRPKGGLAGVEASGPSQIPK